MTKTRAVRDEPAPVPEARIVRALSTGDRLTRAELEQAARDNNDRYGFWGVSVFEAADHDAQRELLAGRLIRFPRVAVFTVGDLVAGGVALLPTGQAPHHDLTLLVLGTPSGAADDLGVLVDRILAVPHTVNDNNHHDPEGGPQ